MALLSDGLIEMSFKKGLLTKVKGDKCYDQCVYRYGHNKNEEKVYSSQYAERYKE